METPLRFRGLARVELLGREVPVATRFASRLVGLALLRRELAGSGLLIPRCRSVHTFGMRFPLDLFFLDGTGRVIAVRREVRRSRVTRCPAAAQVLEVPSASYGRAHT